MNEAIDAQCACAICPGAGCDCGCQQVPPAGQPAACGCGSTCGCEAAETGCVCR